LIFRLCQSLKENQHPGDLFHEENDYTVHNRVKKMTTNSIKGVIKLSLHRILRIIMLSAVVLIIF
jgi:hypothetical protein